MTAATRASASIRAATEDDAAAIAAIYNHYVAHTCTTFETEPVMPATMAQRIAEATAAALPWRVAQTADGIAGYAHASAWKGRCAYRYTLESSVYLDPAHTGRGIGRPLYIALIDAIAARGMHAVIAGIALPNPASIALHEQLGFRAAGRFEQVGHKFERWVDVGYWQLLLPATAPASAMTSPSTAASQNGDAGHQPNSTPASPADSE